MKRSKHNIEDTIVNEDELYCNRNIPIRAIFIQPFGFRVIPNKEQQRSTNWRDENEEIEQKDAKIEPFL